MIYVSILALQDLQSCTYTHWRCGKNIFLRRQCQRWLGRTLKVWGLWQWLCPGYAFLVRQCSSRAHQVRKGTPPVSYVDPQKSTETTYVRQRAWHLSDVEFQMIWVKCVVSISKTYQNLQSGRLTPNSVKLWSSDSNPSCYRLFYLPLLDFPIFQCLIAVLFDCHDKYCPELNFVNLQVNFEQVQVLP